MSNYNQTSVDGESWIRARRVVIENPVFGDKRVRFIEEKAYVLDGKVVSEPYGSIDIVVDGAEDMLDEIDIIDPATGELTGYTMTFQELYAILYSAYIDRVKDRDSITDNSNGEIDG